MAYGDFKDLTRRRASDKFLRDKVFNITKHPKYDGYQRGLALWFINFLIKMLLKVLLLKSITKLNRMHNWLKKCKNQLLENLKK